MSEIRQYNFKSMFASAEKIKEKTFWNRVLFDKNICAVVVDVSLSLCSENS